jgi:uncharacterized membrane protein (TIGR02234 family)
VTSSADSPSENAASARPGRRSLAVALFSGAVGAAVALLSSRQPWAEGAAEVAGGAFPLTARGGDVTGAPAALAIVGLAALVAVFAVRRAGRVLVAGLLALCGAGTVAAALLGASDREALEDKAAQVSGDATAAVTGLSHTAWPYVAAVGGALILAAGLLALWRGSRWPGMSSRYERGAGVPRPRRAAGAAGGAAASADPERPEDLWKALDRGEDPTGA